MKTDVNVQYIIQIKTDFEMFELCFCSFAVLGNVGHPVFSLLKLKAAHSQDEIMLEGLFETYLSFQKL